MNNNALLATNYSDLQAHRDEFRKKQEMYNKLYDINIMKEQIKELMTLRDEFREIKQLLYNHIQRDNQWQV